MKITNIIAICIVAVTLFSGCASPIKRTGYLTNYDKMGEGKYLENYWVNKALISSHKYSKIYVSDIDISRIANQLGVTTNDCIRWLRNSLIDTARETGDHFIFAPEANIAQVKFEIAITEMTPGSAGGRMFAGELGMGHAWIQIEGRLTDAKNGEEIVVLSDRRRSSGAIGLRDIGGNVGPDLVREMLQQVGVDIIKELNESFYFKEKGGPIE